jgi:hypothetical protein
MPASLEERLASVEAEVERLRSRLEGTVERPRAGWECIIGTFADSEGFDEGVRLGREYRESQRPKDDGNDA